MGGSAGVSATDKDKIKGLAERVFSDMADAMTAGMGDIGVETGHMG